MCAPKKKNKKEKFITSNAFLFFVSARHRNEEDKKQRLKNISGYPKKKIEKKVRCLFVYIGLN